MSKFGKVMKEIRKPLGESLRAMAKRLDISPAFLSALEVGKKTIPYSYASKIAKEYELDLETERKIEVAILETNGYFRIDLTKLNKLEKEVALLFARKVKDLTKKQIKELSELLGDEKHESI